VKSQHYSDVEWADFVRGLTAGPARASMDMHLSSGCRRCRRASEVLGAVADVARGEAEREVPAPALRRAIAMFSVQKPERVQTLPRLLARLVFDSFNEPLLAGVRGREHVSRHAMYRAGDYFVDLKLESQPGTRHVSLVGQIANPKAAPDSVANVPVLLSAGPDVIWRTMSNEFGEFQLSYEAGRPLRLHVPVRDGRRIEVALSRLGTAQPKSRKPKGAGPVRNITRKPR
jgi:hypothetical protein